MQKMERKKKCKIDLNKISDEFYKVILAQHLSKKTWAPDFNRSALKGRPGLELQTSADQL
jgi:hypothetical protein